MFDGRTATGWRAEHDPASLATLVTAQAASGAHPRPGGAELEFRYTLAGGASPGRVVALAFDTPRGTAPNDRLTLTIRAEHPMRISLQLRAGLPSTEILKKGPRSPRGAGAEGRRGRCDDLLDDLRFAVDEVVHHHDILLAGIVWPRSYVAARDAHVRDACVRKNDAEERQTPIAR